MSFFVKPLRKYDPWFVIFNHFNISLASYSASSIEIFMLTFHHSNYQVSVYFCRNSEEETKLQE